MQKINNQKKIIEISNGALQRYFKHNSGRHYDASFVIREATNYLEVGSSCYDVYSDINNNDKRDPMYYIPLEYCHLNLNLSFILKSEMYYILLNDVINIKYMRFWNIPKVCNHKDTYIIRELLLFIIRNFKIKFMINSKFSEELFKGDNSSHENYNILVKNYFCCDSKYLKKILCT